MKYKAIIFDMDGTIIDTENIWKEANRELITRRGIPFTPEIEQELAERLRGSALSRSCQIIKELVQLDDHLDNLIVEKARIANSLYEEGITFIEGFVEFHKQVLAHDLKTAIATNAVDSTVDITKRALKLEEFFKEHIYNITHVNNVPKPHPDLYLYVAEQFNLDPDDCIAIEDSAHGIAAAKDAGMLCLGINTSKNRDQLKRSDIIIEGYHEIHLPTLLKKRNN